MSTEFIDKDRKDNQKAFRKFMNACGGDTIKADRLNSIWFTSVPCPTDLDLPDPKTKWEVFQDKAFEEGYTLEQLELFLLFAT